MKFVCVRVRYVCVVCVVCLFVCLFDFFHNFHDSPFCKKKGGFCAM